MAITTWSAKIEEEQKEKLQKLIEESNLSVKDFLGQLVDSYELNSAKIQVEEVSQDIAELTQLTHRINNIFVNVAERIDTIKRTSEIEKEELLKPKEDQIASLHNEVKDNKKLIDDINKKYKIVLNENEDLKLVNSNLEKQTKKEINQLTDINTANAQLLEEYRDKIKTLSEELSKLKHFEAKYKEQKQALTDLTSEIDTLKIERAKFITDLKDLKLTKDNYDELDKTNFKLTAENKELINKLNVAEETHKHAINKLVEEAEHNHNKQQLALEQQYTAKLQKIQTDYNEKVLELIDKLNQNK